MRYAQTVSPQMATQMAKPLPKQEADKGKVWALLIGGAAVLFGATLVAENKSGWFPAVSRANEAMQMTGKKLKVRMPSYVCMGGCGWGVGAESPE